MSPNKTNKGTGAGGANTNKNGIAFENKVYLHDLLIDANYKLGVSGKSAKKTQMFNVFNEQKKLIAIYGRQGRIYDALISFIGSDFSSKYIEEVLSAKINPDAFIFNLSNKTLHIFEKKWQQSAGSVDEKLQTAPFKLEMFTKLVSQFEIKVTYNYILSFYYTNKKFRNIKEYYKNNSNISLYIEGENLQDLNVKDFLED